MGSARPRMMFTLTGVLAILNRRERTETMSEPAGVAGN